MDMNKPQPHLLLLLLVIMLPACGGSSGSNNTTNVIDTTPDADADGIEDSLDNCPNISNPAQIDSNADGTGDACNDEDNDNVIDSEDVDADNDGLIEISTLQQLDWMRNDLTGTSRHDGNTGDSTGCPATGCNGYELVADLDFDTNSSNAADAGDTYFDHDGDGSNSGWLPVGTSTSAFASKFEGNNHIISNLYINRPAGDSETSGVGIGLFGYMRNLGIVNNLILTGSVTSVRGVTNVGALIGNGQKVRLSNITVTATVSGGQNVGGIIGAMGGGNIDTGISTITVSGNNAGGLVGLVSTANEFFSIINSRSSGTVKGNTRAGGLVGNFKDTSTFASNNTVIIRDSSSSADVTGSYWLGGLVGHVTGSDKLNFGLQIENTSASGTVSGNNIEIGGLIGLVDNNVNIRNNQASGDVSGDGFIGGLIGRVFRRVDIVDSSSSGNVTGNVAVGGLVGKINSAGSAPRQILINRCSASGNVSAKSTYSGGLIGWVEGVSSIFSSFATGNVTSTNSDYVGGLIGLARMGATNVLSSYASGKVSGRDYVGGLIGSFNFVQGVISGGGGDIVSKSFSTSTVQGVRYVGGLIGLTYNVRHSFSFATGSVTGSDLVGGLIGDINESFDAATLQYSFSTANVIPLSQSPRIGGLIGFNDGASFTSNYFAIDSSGQINALGVNNPAGSLNPAGTSGDSLADMQTPVAADQLVGGNTLYAGWGTSPWDYGSSGQLPGLVLGATIFRDGDSDGVID